MLAGIPFLTLVNVTIIFLHNWRSFTNHLTFIRVINETISAPDKQQICKRKKIELKLLRAAKNRYVSNFDHY